MPGEPVCSAPRSDFGNGALCDALHSANPDIEHIRGMWPNSRPRCYLPVTSVDIIGGKMTTDSITSPDRNKRAARALSRRQMLGQGGAALVGAAVTAPASAQTPAPASQNVPPNVP